MEAIGANCAIPGGAIAWGQPTTYNSFGPSLAK